jgi:hypothetical protein
MEDRSEPKPLSEDEWKLLVEEYKEVGHEVRYRDVLMVQEFSVSMAGIGLLANYLSSDSSSITQIVIQTFVCASLWLLWVHMRNINQDRLVGVDRKDELSRLLGFKTLHQNIDGISRTPAPRLMVLLMFAVSFIWTGWTIWRFYDLIQGLE